MIRPYNDEDLDQLLDVWYRASRLAHPFLSEAFLTTEREEIAMHWLPLAETIVDDENGRIVGFLALMGNEIGAIFVEPHRQGEGIGRALKDHARASRPFLEVDVFEANALGRRFYSAYGFELVDRHEHAATAQCLLRLRLD